MTEKIEYIQALVNLSTLIAAIIWIYALSYMSVYPSELYSDGTFLGDVYLGMITTIFYLCPFVMLFIINSLINIKIEGIKHKKFLRTN